MRFPLLFSLALGLLTLSGCYKTSTMNVETIDPYRAEGLTPATSGNVELIVSNIDPSLPAPRVLVEIIPASVEAVDEERERRRMMYNLLPNPDAKMLVQSNYTLEPGTYIIHFWEESTGTLSKRKVTIAPENNYITAFLRLRRNNAGDIIREFRIRTSTKPILTKYPPQQLGRF
jgi:hypothetical protein